MRIGLFGGTFNPVHEGHLRLAEGAARHLHLDEVVWIPARLPPHKEVEPEVSAEDRARMVELAIEGDPQFRLCRVELERPVPSYTIDTVRALQKERPDPDLHWFFLVGSDTARELPVWREIEELKKRVKFVAIPRPEHAGAAPLPKGVQEIPVETMSVSSSQVREAVRAGRSIEGWVPKRVMEYIQEKDLYR